jgi:hypothetical protein
MRGSTSLVAKVKVAMNEFCFHCTHAFKKPDHELRELLLEWETLRAERAGTNACSPFVIRFLTAANAVMARTLN